MVSAVDINKDIRSIAKKVKTAVFSYDDIHNKEVNNEFHYDYEKVIGEVQKLRGWTREETINNLCVDGILSPLPNGEYKVDVGVTTKNGGGLNYHGVAFFTFGKNDYHTKYHELAHSLQKEYGLFDDNKINKQYHISQEGLKNTEDKLVDEVTYKQYLKEMHSESFSYAALMLRAKNPLDFARQAWKAYSGSLGRNGEAFFSFGKTEYGEDNNQAKFYSTYPVMKKTIRTIYNLRKQGKHKEFFDEKGVLNDEKLARLCENVVMKSAYSPRTLNSYFKYNLFDGHNDKEHGWRLDTLKSVMTYPTCSVIWLASKENLFSTFNKFSAHAKLEREEQTAIKKMAMSNQHFDNPELQALHDYTQLIAKCCDMARLYRGKFLNADTHLAQATSVLRAPDLAIHEVSIRNEARNSLNHDNKEQYAEEKIALAKFVQQRADNPYFCHLVATKPNMAEVSRMYQEKLASPEKIFIENPVAVKKSSQASKRFFAANIVIENMDNIIDIVAGYECSKEFEKTLIELSFQPAAVIDDKKTREALTDAVQFKNDFWGKEKRRFKRELNAFLDKMSANAFSQRNNPAFKELCAEITDNDASKFLRKAQNIRKQELEKDKEPSQEQSQPAAESEEEIAISIEETGRTDAQKRVKNNLLAIDYLVEEYGCSPAFKQKLIKCIGASAETTDDKDFRHELVNDAEIKGDFFGITKKHFKKDLNQLLDGFSSSAREFGDNVYYSELAQTIARGELITSTEEVNSEPSLEHSPEQTITPAKTAKEIVSEKLHSWGVADGSYMLFTPEDNVYTTYGDNKVQSASSYFEEGAKNVQKTGNEIVYGTNNGIVGAYFAEGAYVVSNNFQLLSKLYHRGKDVDLGVMLSNGEHFVNADGAKNDLLNYKWKNAKQKGREINEVIHNQYLERQKSKEKEQKHAQTSQQKENPQITRVAASR